MKEIEFYSKAQIDASFRQQELEEAFSQKRSTKAMFILVLILMPLYLLYTGVFRHKLPDVDPFILIAVLFVWGFTQNRTKLAALQAIDQVSSKQAKIAE